MAGRATRRGKANPPDNRPASARQLWRLHMEGLVRLVDLDDPELWRPGGPKDVDKASWTITAAEADSLIQRLINERWAGAGRFPRSGDTWTVDHAKGVVRLHGAPRYDAEPAFDSEERKAVLRAFAELGTERPSTG